MKYGHLCLLILLFPFAAIAQEKEDETAASIKLAAAIEKLAGKRELFLSGSVVLEESSDNAMIVVGGQGGFGASDFTGSIEIWRNDEDELVIASRDSLPGFGFFDNGERAVTQFSFEDEGIRIRDLASDLSSLLDLDRLKRSVKKADFETEAVEGDGVKFTGEISKRILRGGSDDSPFQVMAPRVLRVALECTLDDKARLETLKFIVVRSDPFAALKRRAMEGEFEEGIEIRAGGIPEDSEEEGKKSVYELKVQNKGPGKRAESFLKQVRTLFEDEVF